MGWRLSVVFVAAALFAFVPAFDAPFAFDDIPAIAANSSITRLWPLAIPLTPPGETAVSGRPVANFTFALNYATNQALGIDQSPASSDRRKTISYHLLNLALHVACGFLLFAVLRRTLERLPQVRTTIASPEPLAGIATLLWIVHPIQTEAVDYITQRTELLASAFYLAVLYASIRAWSAREGWSRRRWYIVAVVSCALGMGSKEVMATAPLAVMLYDAAFFADSPDEWRAVLRQRRFFYLSLWLALIPLIASIESGARSASVGFHGRITWLDYFVTQGWAIWHYLRLVVWPVGLTFDYGQRPVGGLLPMLGLVGLVGLAGLGIGSLLAWRNRRWLGFAVIWFFLLLAPSSSVIPIQTEIAAERRVYLALVAPIVLLVIFVVGAWRRLTRSAELPSTKSTWRVVASVSCVLIAVSAWRSRVYRDPALLWADAIHKRPTNGRAYDNLAAVILARGASNADSARALLRRAIAVDSLQISAWTNLALLENARHDPAAARSLLERAIRIDPEVIVATRDLGLLLSDLGNAQEAIPYLERVSRATPDAATLHALGSSYAATGRLDDAVASLSRSVSLDPTRIQALELLATLLIEQRRPQDALRYLGPTNRAGMSSARSYALSSFAHAQMGFADSAIADAVAASRVGRNDADVLRLLGRAMIVIQRADAAEEFLTASLQADSSSAEAFTGLAIIAAARGRNEDAKRFFYRALAADSSYQPARIGLTRLK